MAQLSIALLGTCRVALEGETLTAFESDKVRALLAYLAVEDGRPHRRETLAALLWPDATEHKGRQNLRRALYNLRQVLERDGGEIPFLQASRQTMRLNPASDYWLDVEAFSSYLNAGQAHPHRRLDACPSCIALLDQAVDLYRGDFLAGLCLPNCEPFEEWRLFKQEALHGQAMDALIQLAVYHERRRDYATAIRFLRRQIELESWREEAHRQLMRVLALKGERSAALQQYETCRSLLATELGIEPAPETTALCERIRGGELHLETMEIHNPYKGLQAFNEEDSAEFFGREVFVDLLAEAVRRQPLVVLIGPSGSGKSSVVRAGLLPHLSLSPVADKHRPRSAPPADATEALDGSDRGKLEQQDTEESWIAISFRPGSHPLHSLAEALVPIAEPRWREDPPGLLDRVRSVAGQLQAGELGLSDLFDSIMVRAGESHSDGRRLLLVVDQLEEAFTICQDAHTRRIFFDTLLEPWLTAQVSASRRTSLNLLLCLRADFTAQALSYRALSDAIQEGGLALGPMTQEELRLAIEEPARGRGVILEPGMVERLLNDVSDEPGNLPLLQFTLTQLWGHQTGSQLTHAGYERIGGLDGAITRYADSVYEQLSADEQEDARRVFTQLVHSGDGSQDTCRLATRAELGAHWPLVQRLADARLVVTDQNPAGGETAELVHEALIRNWERLQAWMEADRAFHTWRQRLRASLRQWEASGQDNGALLHGVPLAEAEDWAAERTADLSSPEREYLDASVTRRDHQLAEAREKREQELAQARALAEAERQRAAAEHQRAEAERSRANIQTESRRRLLRLAIGYALVLALAAGITGWAVSQQQAAQRDAVVAKSLNLATNSQLALNKGDAGLALALALEAHGIPHPPPQVQLTLAEAAYAPGTRWLLAGHSAPVLDLAISPDGRLAISASADHSLIVWDLTTGQSTQVLDAHSDAVNSVAIGPEGRTALSGSADGSLILWDLATGELLRRFTGHTGAVHDLAISPDGKKALSGGADRSLILWDLASGQAIRLYPGHSDPVLSVAIGPDGLTALSRSADEEIILWDLATGEVINRFAEQTPAVEASPREPLSQLAGAGTVVFGPDGSTVIYGTPDGQIMIWDLATGAQGAGLYPPPGGNLLSLALNPDGRTVLLGTTDNQVALLDLATGETIQRFLEHGGPVQTVAFSPGGRYALSGSADSTVRLWDLESGAELRRMQDREFGVGVDLSPDGRTGLTAARDGSIHIWDYETGNTRQRLGHTGGSIAGAYFTPDGKAIVSWSGASDDRAEENGVHVWGLATGEEVWHFDGHSGIIWDVAVSSDGRLAASASQDGTVRLWDLGRGTSRVLHDVTPQAVRSVAFGPDGQAVLFGLGPGESSVPDFGLRLVDIATGQERQRYEGHKDAVADVAFGPEGRLVLSGSLDGSVILWDAATGRPLRRLNGHPGSVQSVALNPDGRLAVSGGARRMIHVWDVGTGTLLRRFTGHDADVLGVVFAPDGRTLLSVAKDGTVREWHVHASEADLLDWIDGNRYTPDLTCEQRLDFETEAQCNATGDLPAGGR